MDERGERGDERANQRGWAVGRVHLTGQKKPLCQSTMNENNENSPFYFKSDALPKVFQILKTLYTGSLDLGTLQN